MKTVISFLTFAMAAVLAFSCNFDENPEPGESNERWVLAGYQKGGETKSSYTSVRDSAYVYTLSSDGTFRKSIGKQGFIGTYEERFEDGLRKFIFQYETAADNEIHGCSSDQEIYFLNSQGQLTGTWDSCNGDKLYFDKE